MCWDNVADSSPHSFCTEIMDAHSYRRQRRLALLMPTAWKPHKAEGAEEEEARKARDRQHDFFHDMFLHYGDNKGKWRWDEAGPGSGLYFVKALRHKGVVDTRTIFHHLPGSQIAAKITTFI